MNLEIARALEALTLLARTLVVFVKREDDRREGFPARGEWPK